MRFVFVQRLELLMFYIPLINWTYLGFGKKDMFHLEITPFQLLITPFQLLVGLLYHIKKSSLLLKVIFQKKREEKTGLSACLIQILL